MWHGLNNADTHRCRLHMITRRMDAQYSMSSLQITGLTRHGSRKFILINVVRSQSEFILTTLLMPRIE